MLMESKSLMLLRSGGALVARLSSERKKDRVINVSLCVYALVYLCITPYDS